MALAACSLGVLSSAQTNYDFSKLQREKLGTILEFSDVLPQKNPS